MKKTNEFVLEFGRLLKAIQQKKRLIILCMLAGLLLGFAGSKFLLKPQYEAAASLIVNARTDTTANITSSDVSASEDLVETYAYIIQSDTVLDQVIHDLNLDVSFESLAKKITVTKQPGTQIMKIVMRDEDPDQAKAVVRKITEIAPDVIVDKVKAGSVEIISAARATDNPVFPNIPINTLFVGILGLLFSIIFVCWMDLTDDKIKSEEELNELLDISVIGVIPDVVAKGESLS